MSCLYRMKLTSVVMILLAVVHSCGTEHPQKQPVPAQKEVNRSMEEINRQFARDESAQIDGYIERRGWTMSTTGTGLRYMVYEATEGIEIKAGDRIEVNYEVSLLNGDVLYTSKERGPHVFTVGKDNVESGLHEGVLFMKTGEKAKFILPSHLAHGLSGDNDKIPPRSSVVYDIELISVK